MSGWKNSDNTQTQQGQLAPACVFGLYLLANKSVAFRFLEALHRSQNSQRQRKVAPDATSLDVPTGGLKKPWFAPKDCPEYPDFLSVMTST
jgi:hypothetical protein